jgi:hypothetical protein
VKDAIYVLGGLAVVVFFIVRQRRSDRFRERSLIFPMALGIYGVVLLTDTSKHHALTVASAALLILSAVASVGFGVIRGRTIELFTRGASCGSAPRGPRSQRAGVASFSPASL